MSFLHYEFFYVGRGKKKKKKKIKKKKTAKKMHPMKDKNTSMFFFGLETMSLFDILWWKIKQGVCRTVALTFTLKSILRQKKEEL